MLYTLRQDCARDFEGTLRAVASLGYEGVELFDLHGHDAAVVRRWLDELGLVACGRHAGLGAVETELAGLAGECAVLGIDRLVLSWIEAPRWAPLLTVSVAIRSGRASAAAKAIVPPIDSPTR